MSNLQNLRNIRESRGYTQQEVADTIGMSRQSYAAVESGSKDITLTQADTLSSKLRISVESLRSGSEDHSLIDPVASVEKYKQIILNAVKAGADKSDKKITKTKLAKLVYLADFLWYYKHQKPMSGMQYRKLPQGPVSDVYFRALDELEEEGSVEREEKGRAFMYKLVESGEAPSNRLMEGQKELIQKIGLWWQDKQTKEIVDFTHKQLPWQICRDGEVIPYGLITQEEPELVHGDLEL